MTFQTRWNGQKKRSAGQKMVESYKGRQIDFKKRIEVYRNLRKTEEFWYSIKQDGKVVGHTGDIELRSCHFQVNEAGRQRVLKTGQKNVHAYVVGYPIRRLSKGQTRMKAQLGGPCKGMYNPRHNESFIVLENGTWQPVSVSMYARLGPEGLQVWGRRL